MMARDDFRQNAGRGELDEHLFFESRARAVEHLDALEGEPADVDAIDALMLDPAAAEQRVEPAACALSKRLEPALSDAHGRSLEESALSGDTPASGRREGARLAAGLFRPPGSVVRLDGNACCLGAQATESRSTDPASSG